ncbi:K+-transporting ATPase ATPase A chain [Pseudochelatococcus lubricantis]|uniref:Potassium-transporting ATPase potassium-binding subunit n=1 Tax=Pseudochelatococcus lubricantis TaxID=1538102 RepID=A0ABX0V3M8_9HYPH|nr:potassium-transporting ATPase subunit KdpA [Pseudochelatococcus lubricantis]NIJ59823.1 K+-transporting ATPase ATPase A chain [Pseudochelatococcus lubricantis]
MTMNGWIQILIFFGIVIALVKPLGGYINRVMNGDRTPLSIVFGSVERGLYRLAGTDEKEEQHWTTYMAAMLFFNLAGFLLLYLLQRAQGFLPFNPAGLGAVSADSSFNTAVSFMTNTNWQGYAGESTMSYLTQMAGVTVQNFVSAAVGVAGAMAIIRGFARASAKSVGNFWVDLTRATLYILLPICVVGSLVLVWQGVPQNLNPYTVAATLEGGQQTIAQGPVASQMIIKHLGTNGGGFFNANSAHPFENPTALTNLLHLVSIFAISFAMLNVFGRQVGNQKQGWALLGVIGAIVVAGVVIVYWAEAAGNPLAHALGVEGGNLEGKETRFGLALSSLFAVVTTSASTGAVNGMHDSLMPLGGLVPLFNMQIPPLGGIGAGVYGVLIFAILAVFIAGLMVGRTPEYLGKKIEAKEVKMSILAMLGPSLAILVFTAIAVVVPVGLSSIQDAGPHGFSEVLYAYTSGANNNGSAFAGLSANTPFYNITIGLAMLMGRFLLIVPVLAIAGSLAAKKTVPASAGTLPTTGPLFIGLVIGVTLIVGGLTFFPALALGPIVEHFALLAGQTF